MPEHSELATQYTLSLLPLEHDDLPAFSITVDWRGQDRYAVVHARRCLSSNGTWDLEPSNREVDWLASHRFDLDTALRLARAWLPRVGVNGWTAADVVTRDAGR